MRFGRGLALGFAALFLVKSVAAGDDRTLREWMQNARVPETRADALARFRRATVADLPELRLLVDDARRVPGEGVARMLEDPRRDCRGKASDADAWLGCIVEKLEGKTTVNAKSATELACALIGARAAKGIDGFALAASMGLDAKGAFEAIVQNTLKAGGDEAVAGLFTARRDGSVPVKKWAAERLEAMHKRKPAEVGAMSDANSVARVLSIFGAWKEPDALALLIERIDADRREVRGAAREGVRAYGREAIWKLREAYREAKGEAAPEDWFSKRLADELFALLDARRLGPAMEALEAARAKARDGHPREAAAEADRALRLAPEHPERVELAGFLVAAAHDASEPVLSASDREGLLLRASWAGGDELAASLASEVRALHADVLAAHGVSDRTLTGAPSSVAVAPPPRDRRLDGAAALGALSCLLAGVGEGLRRRDARERDRVQAAHSPADASAAEDANEERS